MKGKMIKKVLKWLGIIFGVAAAICVLLIGGMYLTVFLALEDADAPYEPQPDGYWQRKISRELLLDVQDAEVLYEMDTHGGFHGDGVTTVSLKPSGSLFAVVADDSLWHELPLPRKLRSGYFENDEGNSLLEQITNGYYFFVDRYRETGDIFDPFDSGLWHIPNYTLAVYDADENVLYYLSVDT